jgi:hypothetical protein
MGHDFAAILTSGKLIERLISVDICLSHRAHRVYFALFCPYYKNNYKKGRFVY